MAWAATRRRDQVIAIRIAGPRVPRSRDGVLAGFEWFLVRELLAESDQLGMVTDREVLERAEDLTA